MIPAAADACVGRPVSLSGKVLGPAEGSDPVQYTVATRGNNEDTVIIEFPKGIGDPGLLPNEKVEVYGTFMVPVAKDTETGLRLSTLRVSVDRINGIVTRMRSLRWISTPTTMSPEHLHKQENALSASKRARRFPVGMILGERGFPRSAERARGFPIDPGLPPILR